MARSSGVIGADGKWLLVPRNDKPERKRTRWMYVCLAVDVCTYDLLHIDMHAHNGKLEARAFLQALKIKGYQPQVIVTDVNYPTACGGVVDVCNLLVSKTNSAQSRQENAGRLICHWDMLSC